jgi:hypothetical protein
VFTILPIIEDADTTCPKDTTASSRNKPGLPGTPASPWAWRTPEPRQGHPDSRALQVRQDPGTRQALSRRWTSSTGSLRRRHGHHPDQLRQQRSRQHHPRQRITNRSQLQLGTSDPTPDKTLATASVLGQAGPAYLQALQEPESPPWAIRQAGMCGRRCCPPDPWQGPNGHANERPVRSGQLSRARARWYRTPISVNRLAIVVLEIMRRWRGAAVESGNWVPRRWCVRIVAGRGLPGDRLAAGWVEGAQLCWRAVRRHRPPMDRSRP